MEKTFTQKVIETVKKIPSGRVMSYAQVAALSGSERAARAVGHILHNLQDLASVPWHRVISSKGYITTTCKEHTYITQKQLLEKEGVEVIWDEKKRMYWVDMKRYNILKF